MPIESQQERRDALDLQHFGYRQRLSRSLGAFSSFAASFSALSVSTGVFQVFFIGYAYGGAASFWFWPFVFFGQFMVALCFAELAARYPLAGAAYQWSRQLAGRSWGWHTGWMYLAAQLVTYPALVVAYQLTLPQLSSVFSISKDFSRNSVILGMILLVVGTVVNLLGVRIMAYINNIGVVTEIVGAVVLIVLLAVHVRRGPGVVFDTNGTGAGHAWGYFGAFLVAGIFALYNMYAFDTAATLAEETEDPRRHAPRAVLRALAGAGILGFFMLLFALMAVKNLRAPEMGSVGFPYIVTSTLGNAVGDFILVIVTISITVCGLAIQAWCSRTLFAMGRDGDLPFSRGLSRVTKHQQAPAVPILVTAGIGMIILLINLPNPKAFNAIVALGIVFIYLAYLMVTASVLKRRLSGWPNDGGREEGLFTLGRWGLLVNIVAVVYGGVMFVNLIWPRADFYGPAWYQQYIAVIFVPVVIVGGLLYYGLVLRRRQGRVAEEDSERQDAPSAEQAPSTIGR